MAVAGDKINGKQTRGLLTGILAMIYVGFPLGAAGQTSAGSEIRSAILVRYQGPAGQSYTDSSNTLSMIVAQAAGVDVESPLNVVSDPGQTVLLPHVVTNVGNGLDSMSLAAVSASGWPVRVYRDNGADGSLDPGDGELTSPLVLAQNESAAVLIAVDIPNLATLRGTSETISLTATCRFDPGVTDVLQDVLTIRDVGTRVTLIESVDRTTATSGDILTYTISYTASGLNPATSVEIANVIPIGTTYVSGAMKWNGSDLSDAPGDDAGYFDAGQNRVVFQVGDLNDGDAGTVSFQVRINQ